MNLKLPVVIAGAGLVAMLFSCKTPQKDMGCRFEGEVVDMTGLDGCGLMIQLNDKDHSKLQVAEITDSSFRLRAGQKIKFNYTELHDRASNCMAGKIVRIDCIKER